MSLTLIFAAAIQSPWDFRRRSRVTWWSFHRSLGLLFVRGFLCVFFFFAGLFVLLFVFGLARVALDLVDLLVLARELDHLRGRVFIHAFDGGEVFDRSV